MLAPSAEDIQLFVRLQRRDHAGVGEALRRRQAPLAQLVETAAEHGLSVVLLRTLADSPARARFDAAALARLEKSRERQGERGRRLLEALERLAARLDAAGQRFLLLKGPYLAQRYYGDVDGREFVDLDLLVPRADRARVFRMLAECGYAPRSSTFLGTQLTCFFVHAFDFSDGVTPVDLHWCLSRHPSLRVDEAALWARSGRYTIGERSYGILAEEDEILFAALSLVRDLERGRPKLKNIVDLLTVLEAADATQDWQALLEGRRSEGIAGALINVLDLCLDVAQAGELAPRLRAALTLHAERRVPRRSAGSPLAFAPTAYNLGNRVWCARVYDTSLPAWLAWWAVSLPFRLAVHRRVARPR